MIRIRCHFEQVFAGRPLGRAQPAGLERLQDAQRLFDRAADVVVGHDRVAQHAFRVDDEQAALCGAGFLVEHAVRPGDFLGEVGDQRVRRPGDAVLVERGVEPREVRVDAVGRRPEHLGVEFVELVEAIGQGQDLRRADEREIERVEEKDQPLALVVGQADLPAQILRAGRALGGREGERRGGLTDLG
jgi:hypothetical protein